MVRHILALPLLPCNEINKSDKNNKINNSNINNAVSSLNEISNFKENNKIRLSKNIYDQSDDNYISFPVVQKIIHRLLTCNRIVLSPTLFPKFTQLELAAKLNITVTELISLQTSRIFYKKLAKKISWSLAKLYCSSALQKSNLLHSFQEDSKHGGVL